MARAAAAVGTTGHMASTGAVAFMHSRFIRRVPEKSPAMIGKRLGSSGTKIIPSIGPSLVAWLMPAEKEGLAGELLVGIDGPTQRWTVVDPETGLRYREYVAVLEKMHGSKQGQVAPLNVVRTLFWGNQCLVSITEKDVCRCFAVAVEGADVVGGK